jgi:hypothetical protein
MTTNSPDDLAARLDDSLPPGRVSLDATTRDPAIRAAVELARDSRPVLSAAARARIQAQVLAQADHVFARRAVVRRRMFLVAGRAAAAVLIIFLAALLVTTTFRHTPQRPAPLADQAQSSPVFVAPSAPDTAVFIPQDGVSGSLVEIGAGSTSIFIQPLNP